MIYLVKCEAKKGNYYKIGFTQSNIEKRMLAYYTHNPTVELVATAQTYNKTKMSLETQAHKELLANGFKFQVKITPKGKLVATEWVFVPEGKTFKLENLKCMQGRKITKY